MPRLLLDGTSVRREHSDLTGVVDADTHELLFQSEGRASAVVTAFMREMRAHGGAPELIKFFAMGLSQPKAQREHPGVESINRILLLVERMIDLSDGQPRRRFFGTAAPSRFLESLNPPPSSYPGSHTLRDRFRSRQSVQKTVEF